MLRLPPWPVLPVCARMACQATACLFSTQSVETTETVAHHLQHDNIPRAVEALTQLWPDGAERLRHIPLLYEKRGLTFTASFERLRLANGAGQHVPADEGPTVFQHVCRSIKTADRTHVDVDSMLEKAATLVKKGDFDAAASTIEHLTKCRMGNIILGDAYGDLIAGLLRIGRGERAGEFMQWMMNAGDGAAVSTAWLQRNLHHPRVKVLDATWLMPTDTRNAKHMYTEEHIPGARFFDVDQIADISSGYLSHMLPTRAQFALALQELGIGADDKVVVYDKTGIFSAPRVWWTFRVYGFRNVGVLDGGFPKWKIEYPDLVESGDQESAKEPHPIFPLTLNAEMVSSREDVEAILLKRMRTSQIVDARSQGRFVGKDPEPRPGLRSGHMPGALSVPFTELLQPDGCIKPPEELFKAFRQGGMELPYLRPRFAWIKTMLGLTQRPRTITTSCGSGLTAAGLSWALHLIGCNVEQQSLYDGSWTEWATVHQENPQGFIHP